MTRNFDPPRGVDKQEITMPGVVDKYANILTAFVDQSAANIITFTEINTGLGIEPDRKTARAMIIDEIEYHPRMLTGISQMTTHLDQMIAGITLSNNVSDLEDVTDRRILHAVNYFRFDGGTAANLVFERLPWIYQFFPPLITAERKIYLGFDSVGLAAATRMTIRVYYRVVEIQQADFIELAEVFRLVG